jgi:transposase
MDVQRTVTIHIADDPDLRATLAGFQGVQQRISAVCYNFTCPHCVHEAHADVNAAVNIRLRYTALRLSGPLSTGPKALSSIAGDEGKLPALAGSR